MTVAYDTLGKDSDTSLQDTVTVRSRDTIAQERIAVADLQVYLRAAEVG